MKLRDRQVAVDARVGDKRWMGFAALCTIAAWSAAPARAQDALTHWTMPPVAVAEAERPSWPNVFGTVAVPVRPRQTSTRWTKLLRAALDQPALARLTSQAQGLSQQEQVAFIQAAVNRATRWRPDSHDCADDGYWAAGSETLARGLGDCFDVAVAKMEALRSLGFADRDLYLTTGYFPSTENASHRRGTAALLVHIGDGFLLLPDRAEPVIEARDATEGGAEGDGFNPYITYGYGMTWVHGRLVRSADAAARGQSVAALAR